MTIQEIKEAVDAGKNVCWSNERYRVTRDSLGQYNISCFDNDNCIGLHGKEGTQYANSLNGQEKDFYIL